MLQFYTRTLLLIAVALVGISGHAALSLADDFRVDNAVYTDNQKEPSSRSVTIFHDGIVYDCMKTPAETVVFDKAAEKFTLLNQANRTRAELTTGEVTAFVSRFENRLRSMVAKNPDPLIAFLADPKFQERFDESSRELTLSSPLVSYRLMLLTGESETAVQQYREFADWYTRLNTLLTPGVLPPFGRLAVDAAIADRKAIASQVVLTMSSAKSDRRRTIRSTHEVVRPLPQTDLDCVATIRKSMSDFKLVSFEKYRKADPK